MERKERLLEFLQHHGKASMETIHEQVAPELCRQTLWRGLKSLNAEKLVRREGTGSGTRWFAGGIEAIRRYLRRPCEQRPPVTYDWTILDEYRPNQTFHLDELSRRRMREHGTAPTGYSGPSDPRVITRFMMDLAWKSSSLEGNTYTLAQTERLLRDGERAPGRTEEETIMVLNHRAALDYALVTAQDDRPLSSLVLRDIHALVSENLLAEPLWEGALRQFPVIIGGSAYRPMDNPHQIQDTFQLLLNKVAQVEDPFEQAFLLWIHIPYLQPFMDCNKRTGRVAVNIPLLRHGLSPISYIEMPHKDYIDGLLGFYEMGDTSLLQDLFSETYIKGARRYWTPIAETSAPAKAIRDNRDFIHGAIGTLVRNHGGYDPDAARDLMEKAGLDSHDEQRQLSGYMRMRIDSLHEGNLVRYGLTMEDLQRLRQNRKPVGSDGTAFPEP